MSNDVRRWNTDGDLELDSDGLGELVLVSDHDRVVAFWKELAEKRYQEMVTCQETIAQLRAEVEIWKQKHDLIVSFSWMQKQELETARRVREKLTEQRNAAPNMHWDVIGYEQLKVWDAEIAAIEKDGTK